MQFRVFDDFDEAVVAVDSAGSVLYANPSAATLYGYEGSAEKRAFSSIARVLDAEQSEADLSFARRAPFHRRCRHVDVRGREHEVEWFLRWEEDANPPFYLSVARPLKTETSVDDRARLRAFIDALPDSALFVDAEYRTVVANQAFARILGAAPEAIVGTDALERFPAELAENRRRMFEQARLTQKPVRFEDTRGDHRYLSTISPVFASNGRFDGAAIIAFDVTELEREHTRRQELEERLAQAQRLESIGRLAGGVAHDFNNLLTGIFGFVELSLEDLEEDHPVRENMASIREAGEHAADLTRRLLAFSRRQIIEPRVLDLNEIVERTRVLLSRVIGEDVQLVFLPSAGKAMVHIDPTQVNQILMNLATNARDAMPGGGRLTLETSHVNVEAEFSRLHPGLTPGPHVQLAVSDSGTGMSAEAIEKVFEPFFTTKSRDRGTGLGLSTVHGIVSQNGGAITVYSEVGVGTTFKIYLPRARSATGAASPRRPSPIPRVQSGSTVLLVEDETLVRQVARRILERSGYTVVEATDGASAIQAHERLGTVGVLLTDVIMPDMNGRELLSRLQEKQPGLECLFMSGYTDNVIVHHGVLDPGVSFLEKPFTAQALIGKLEQVLSSGAPLPNTG